MASGKLGFEANAPNLLTLTNLLCGFFALHAATGEGLFGGGAHEACRWILIAMVFDGLDGFIARRLGVESDFGRRLDALADMVSFGAAPALIVALLFGPAGLMAGSAYAAAVALRLARFLSESPEQSSSRGFSGLPSPAAALVVVGMVMAGIGPPILLLVVVILGAMMISRSECPHPAALGWWAPAVAMAIAAVFFFGDLPHAILVAAAGYFSWTVFVMAKSAVGARQRT